jgi:hypothetical protein
MPGLSIGSVNSPLIVRRNQRVIGATDARRGARICREFYRYCGRLTGASDRNTLPRRIEIFVLRSCVMEKRELSKTEFELIDEGLKACA